MTIPYILTKISVKPVNGIDSDVTQAVFEHEYLTALYSLFMITGEACQNQ